jgi:tetratricopeptide (TPR) repeat protein
MSKSRRERFDAVKYGSLLSALTLGCLIFALPVSPYNELPLTGQAKESPGLMRRGFTHLSNFEMDSAIRCWAPLAVHYAKDLSDQEKRKKCAQVMALIARSFQFDENDLAAEQLYHLAHELNPSDKRVAALEGLMLSRTGRMAEADKVLQGLANDASSNLTVAGCLAQHLTRSANDRAAREVLRKALENDSGSPASAEANWLMGISMVRINEAKLVSKYFHKAAAATPSLYLKKLCTARAFLCEEKKTESEEACRQAGDILPKDPGWLIALSNTQRRSNPLENAEVSFKDRLAAANLQRCSTTLFIGLTEQLANQERFDQARRCAEYWKLLRPAAYEPCVLSARLYDRMNKPELAEKELKRALVLNPRSSHAWVELAELVAKTRSRSEAIDLLKQAAQTCPYSPKLAKVLGEMLLRSNRIGEAEHAYENAGKLMPSDTKSFNILSKKELADVYAGLGTCAYRTGRANEAFRYAKLFNVYKFVIHLDGVLGLVHVRPDRLDFESAKDEKVIKHEALADMLYEAHDFDDSIKEYRLAVAGDPDNIDLHSYLFFVLQDKNDWSATMSEDFELASKLVAKIPHEIGDALKKGFAR